MRRRSRVRGGLKKCAECRKQFTVTVGTVFEDSHVPLNKWLIAVYLLCSSKKGMSAHQLHRMLGVTYKTAWFMFHRLRFAVKQPGFTGPLGGPGKIVEADGRLGSAVVARALARVTGIGTNRRCSRCWNAAGTSVRCQWAPSLHRASGRPYASTSVHLAAPHDDIE